MQKNYKQIKIKLILQKKNGKQHLYSYRGDVENRMLR